MSITYKVEIGNGGIENFSVFVEEIFKTVLECGKRIVKEQLENLDEKLMQERDSKRYRNKGSRKTSVKTKLGTIEYNRRIYYDTLENKHIFLLDEAISPHSTGLYDETICGNIEEMICNQSFWETARSISETTGLDITHQAVWNIVQDLGKKALAYSKEPTAAGTVESKILYEEDDGDWLNLRGKDRKKHGKSREMKIGIAYDGVLHQVQKGGKIRKELDNKVAYASFESADKFRKHKENVIASVYNTDEIELRVKNGDGANWIQKDNSCECVYLINFTEIIKLPSASAIKALRKTFANCCLKTDLTKFWNVLKHISIQRIMSMKNQSFSNFTVTIQRIKKHLQVIMTGVSPFRQQESLVSFITQDLAVWREMFSPLLATE